MTDTVAVDEQEAARLIRTLDKIEGRETDPRIDAIADATVRPATIRGRSSVGVPVADEGEEFALVGGVTDPFVHFSAIQAEGYAALKEGLSDTDLRVLDLFRQGKHAHQIANELDMPTSAVEAIGARLTLKAMLPPSIREGAASSLRSPAADPGADVARTALVTEADNPT